MANPIFVVTMLILPKVSYKSTFLHCSNILIEIPCNNVQFFPLVHAHTPKFGLFLLKPFQIFSCSFSFFFFSCSRILVPFYSSHPSFWQEKVWTKSPVNPEKGTLIITGVLACLCTDFAPKTQRVFFFD